MKDISIIVPFYNEEDTIRISLERLRASFDGLNYEIILVDDGSVDKSSETAKVFEQFENISYLLNERNMGKTRSIVRALSVANGNYVAIHDADLEYHPDDLLKLFKKAQQDQAPVVFGSRIIQETKCKRSYQTYYFGGRFLTALCNLLFRTQITDLPVCYKVIRQDVLKRIPITGGDFTFCAEITGKLAIEGHKIIELPVSYEPRSFSEGKKIRFYHGLTAFLMLLKIRFFYKNSFK